MNVPCDGSIDERREQQDTSAWRRRRHPGSVESSVAEHYV
jgi:hypothetical protein